MIFITECIATAAQPTAFHYSKQCASCIMTVILQLKHIYFSGVIKHTAGHSPQHWSSLFGWRWLPWANAWRRFNCMCFCVIMSSPLCRQMLLPEGIRRENNKMYEEVEIPHNEPMPTGFEEKPVYILELDEVSGGLFTAVDIYQCLCSHSMSFSQLITPFLLFILTGGIKPKVSTWCQMQHVMVLQLCVMFVFCSVKWRAVLTCLSPAGYIATQNALHWWMIYQLKW